MIAVGKQPPPRYKATPDEPKDSQQPHAAAQSSQPAPSGKGGGPATPSDLDAGRPEQDVTISPEAVCYHDSSRVCSSCEYLAGDQCRVLKMPVDPQGHCSAYEAKAGDMDGTQGEEGMDFHQGSEQFGRAQ